VLATDSEEDVVINPLRQWANSTALEKVCPRIGHHSIHAPG
jgi:hypothetical protein